MSLEPFPEVPLEPFPSVLVPFPRALEPFPAAPQGSAPRGQVTMYEHLTNCVLGLVMGNVQRFRGGLVFKAHRFCVSLNSRLPSNKEEEETAFWG